MGSRPPQERAQLLLGHVPNDGRRLTALSTAFESRRFALATGVADALL
jgi:hypothetical protein